MYKPDGPIGFWSATLMGVGAMVGAGIFALLGEAAAIARSGVYLSFLASGIIALASAYSLARLGARYPAAGGIVEYLVQAFGVGVFSGGMSVVLYVGTIVSMTLVAESFGNYAAVLMLGHTDPLWIDIFATGIVLVFAGLNLRGPGDVALFENIIVVIKLGALAAFMLGGLIFVQPALLRPSEYAPPGSIIAAIGITFFAYEGFRVITNTAEDMREPGRTLPRAMMTAVLLVMALYVLLSLAVFGNLPVNDAMKAKEYALAEAARPVFGETGFIIVVLTALVSTATAINAGLFAATNVTYQLAKDGELPQAFQRTIAHSREGLLISSGIIIVLVITFNLKEIAVIGSITVLLVHGATHVGHLWKLRGETGANVVILWFAVLSTFGAVAVITVFQVRHDPLVVLYVLGFMAAAFITEWLLTTLRNRQIQTRVPD